MRAGDVVRLRRASEILASLDEEGCLDGLPFMPEMLDYVDRTITVDAKVDRACDTITQSGIRKIDRTVLLEQLRCSGQAHGGCQAECRLYWKEAWLRPAGSNGPADTLPSDDEAYAQLERLALENARTAASTDETPIFRCQATELLRASEPVGWWNVRSFLGELTGGNVGPVRFVAVMTRIVIGEIGRRLGLLTVGYPFKPRELSDPPVAAPAPAGLEVGSLVKVRSRAEIAGTIDAKGKNRGLWFDREMLPYCGRSVRVHSKVERFVDEKTGKLVELASDCYILDGVVCSSYHSEGRWFCPREIYSWWRECSLEPVEDAQVGRGQTDPP